MWRPPGVRYAQFGLQTFFLATAAPFTDTDTDTDIVADMNFVVGIDKTANLAPSGLPPRSPVLFGGSEVGQYKAATGPFAVYGSGTFDLGDVSSEWTPFCVYPTQEWAAGVPPGNNLMPRSTLIGTTQPGVYNEPATFSGSSLIASGWSLTLDKIGAETTALSAVYTPMVRWLAPASFRSVGMLCSSSGAGVGETNGGTAAFPADTRGNAHGNKGWPERWVNRTLGIGHFNLAKPSDRLQYLAQIIASQGANWRLLKLMQWGNPTDLMIQPAPNDASGGRTLAKMLADYATIASLMQANLPDL